MKQFNVPISYRSPLISRIKETRRKDDKLKKDFTPTKLELGKLTIYLARHFGFCYGVENAIEIAFSIIESNPGKRLFLLSEMIHNQMVNEDLLKLGVTFLMDTKGNQLIPFDTLTAEDIVIVPAFGTTLQIEETLSKLGIQTKKYNTTCPFVEKVWNRAEAMATKNYSVIVHGKPSHEETRATFSHSASNSPTVVVNDMKEAIELGKYINGEKPAAAFYEEFEGQYSNGFDVTTDLERIGVVNQTTMLASDTEAISEYLKNIMILKYSLGNDIEERFADTRDTLCYATYENQAAASGLLQVPADLAIVIGGYNSSNTSHLVELCEEKLPTYFINSADNIKSLNNIIHYDFVNKLEIESNTFLPIDRSAKILITSGASCPDSVVQNVIERLAEICGVSQQFEALVR